MMKSQPPFWMRQLNKILRLIPPKRKSPICSVCGKPIVGPGIIATGPGLRATPTHLECSPHKHLFQE
jgi:hypothetical protein